ncbi:helix-turn-helix transcriptional regulator [Ferrimicrobium sp.]|uniref:helix-turn-helix transcriptional regulator n=1 Tax=Ferrimicrobium sp. TaxID=2926050 RepID=UPI0026373A80|nr:helix-turn-helix transcriptional regulator [Ferrimicrobium sp.]
MRGHVVVAVKLLRERMVEPWTFDTLAAEVHLSRSQLVLSFDAHYGVSPTGFRRRGR